MVEEPTEGKDYTPAGPPIYRGWTIRVGFCKTRGCFVAYGTHGPRAQAVGLSAISPQHCLEDAQANIDANYSMNADMLMAEAIKASKDLPAWVPDEQYLARRERDES